MAAPGGRRAGRRATGRLDVWEAQDTAKRSKSGAPAGGYGKGGTRFKVLSWPGAARNIYEKLDDAAYINKLTGVAPSVAIHIPWDQVKD